MNKISMLCKICSNAIKRVQYSSINMKATFPQILKSQLRGCKRIQCKYLVCRYIIIDGICLTIALKPSNKVMIKNCQKSDTVYNVCNYVFAGSPWKDQISLAILDLQEKGEIQMLYNKWWRPPTDMCVPEEPGAGTKTNTLDFKNTCKSILFFNYYLLL